MVERPLPPGRYQSRNKPDDGRFRSFRATRFDPRRPSNCVSFFPFSLVRIRKRGITANDPLTILTNCKNAYMTDNGQKSRFILEEMFRTVIENNSRYLVLLLYEISFS